MVDKKNLIDFRNPSHPLHWFENTTDITRHLWQLAWSFMASDDLEQLDKEERSNWLFKHCMLVRYFEETDSIE